MTARQRVWTVDEVLALGVRTSVPIAGDILAGLCKDESYRMVKRGEFPVPVVKIGRNRLVVPTEPILRLLRLSPSDEGSAGHAPPDLTVVTGSASVGSTAPPAA